VVVVLQLLIVVAGSASSERFSV